MSERELAELLSILEMSYPFFEPTKEVEKAWFEVMNNYDFEEVKHNLEIAMADTRFQKEPPKAYYLIQGLTPISKKVDFGKVIIYCQCCKKAVNQLEEEKHTDRCQSIRYLVKQYKKWCGRDLDKRSLWQMSEEEFGEKYEKLLRYIQEHTAEEHEKIRIGFIFKKPNQEVAKNFLGGSKCYKNI